MQAKGEFDITRVPQESLDIGGGAVVGHMRFDKRFHGPLDASSVVHMLAMMSPVSGSGAYVALERIEGTLDGRVMDRGAPRLDLTVVPDSGTGELAGLHGRIAIDIVDGRHHYTFDYGFRDT
ncbi:MAG: DUF3224 domain-containing protein [Stenotrophomonas sp.]|uniref:DUF3224 domain-containing protein n=1 Tax=Stenotrophomonas sp. TaxID=69392 RepID=UPI001354CDB0|nr:DUF3224 domain-containing protein [Stenotrophomonas sp.]MTI73193.1 DUF3224 domain-containing protein [Stenotrophomonas sp.]